MSAQAQPGRNTGLLLEGVVLLGGALAVFAVSLVLSPHQIEPQIFALAMSGAIGVRQLALWFGLESGDIIELVGVSVAVIATVVHSVFHHRDVNHWSLIDVAVVIIGIAVAFSAYRRL
jgi:hypothetical protein